jgi:hypothetical protein
MEQAAQRTVSRTQPAAASNKCGAQWLGEYLIAILNDEYDVHGPSCKTTHEITSYRNTL